jgi:bis(5'-adenosyl)-triphosphatase
LVSPRRCVPRLSDLTGPETADLFLTVRKVGRMVERVYDATSLNIAIQDGEDAGQSVPHMHTHIIPRRKADLDHKGGMDAVYGMLEGEEGDLGRIQKEAASLRADARDAKKRAEFPKVDNERRMPRSEEEMAREAAMLAREMEKEDIDE